MNGMRDQLKKNSESNRAKDNLISSHVESIVSTTTDAKKSPLISCGGLACTHSTQITRLSCRCFEQSYVCSGCSETIIDMNMWMAIVNHNVKKLTCFLYHK